MTPSPFAYGSNAPIGFRAITSSASTFGTMTTFMFGSFSNDVKAQPYLIAPLFGLGFVTPINLNPTPPSYKFL
jgi:hypothetical protein